MVFLDKPAGWSSRKAVNEVARLFSAPGKKRIKAGHAGTLDPLATGMLPILIGEATRFSDIGLDADKRYRVSMDLSFQTDTLDAEGAVVSCFDALPQLSDIERVLPDFRGEIMQRPPQYSAIHVDGKRAHEIMREGGEVELPPRPVTIHELLLLEYRPPLLTLEVACSKGTYVRSLARDIGAALGAGGCVTALRRLSTAGWPEPLMVSFQALQSDPPACLLPLARWLRHLPVLSLSRADALRFAQGQRIQLAAEVAEGEVGVFLADEISDEAAGERPFLGTGEVKSGLRRMVLHPGKVLPSALQRLKD